jgi:hypothetical protein
VIARVWTWGDPEPDDHPNVVAGDCGNYLPGPAHYRWEPPCEDNGFTGGWWCVEAASDLWDWDTILAEETILTEELSSIE